MSAITKTKLRDIPKDKLVEAFVSVLRGVEYRDEHVKLSKSHFAEGMLAGQESIRRHVSFILAGYGIKEDDK